MEARSRAQRIEDVVIGLILIGAGGLRMLVWGGVTLLIAVFVAGCGGSGGGVGSVAVAGADFCPSWSPDGQFVAFERPYEVEDSLQWDVHVVDAAGRSLHRLTHTPEDEEVLGWRNSPQQIIFLRKFGTQFNSVRSEVFALAPTEQAQEEKIGDLPSVNNRVLSPDGAWLAVTVEREDGIHSDVIVSPVGGGPRLRLPRNYVVGGLPQWSPDGRRLAYADGAETFRVVGRDGRTLDRVAGNYPVWSPDGRMIVYFGIDQLRVYDVTRRESRGLGSIDADQHLAWSPDGRTVLYGRVSDVWGVSASGGASRRLFSAGGDGFECLTFSPIGRRVAFLRETFGGHALDPAASDLVLANADGSDMRTVPSADSK